MALLTNSYGDTGEIASITPRYADATTKLFTTATRPTLAQIESFTDQVSGLMNAMLAEAGFTIPVTQADCKLALDMFANDEVAAIADGVNGSGRFGPSAKTGGGQKGRFAIILDDVKAFITANAAGFERLGAGRSYAATAGLGYRDTDERGNATYPLFQRDAFSSTFKDWDSD